MTRLEEIEKVANDYSDRYNYRNRVKRNLSASFENFVEGALWADTHPQSQWISISDQLPKQGQRVYVACKVGSATSTFQAFYNGNEWGMSININIGELHFSVAHSLPTGRDSSDGVFAWMPIPAPPQEGGQQ